MTFENTHNPILPLDIHIPDSEARVMPDGKLYIYGSFDEREDVFCSDKYHVASTADMQHWQIHPEAFNGHQVPWFDDPNATHYPGIDWQHPTPFVQKMLQQDAKDGKDMKQAFEMHASEQKPPLLFAPDCIYHDGRYYLYFDMSDDTEGVAIGEHPEGPFSAPRQLPIGGIDPSVFVDDDGRRYLYWGQLFSHGVELDSDMHSLNRDRIVDNLVTEQEHYFHEGSSMRKIGDTYYYVYANMQRGKPTALGYSTSKNPLGPFTYRGIIIDNAFCDPQSWNNHGSIEQFKGKWYVFYHRSSRGSQKHRRLCIEPISIDDDGTIKEVPMTSQGPGAPFGPNEPLMGYQACEVHGSLFIDVGSQFGEQLTNIENGDRAVFRYIESSQPWQAIDVQSTGSAVLQIMFDQTVVGKVQIKNGEVESADLAAQPGRYEVNLTFSHVDHFALQKIVFS